MTAPVAAAAMLAALAFVYFRRGQGAGDYAPALDWADYAPALDWADYAPAIDGTEVAPAIEEQDQSAPWYESALGTLQSELAGYADAAAAAVTGNMASGDNAARNRAAFLDAIAYAEGTAGPNGYRTLFGGGLFDSFADHPRRSFSFRDKAGRNLKTTAAGRYQFLARTWDTLRARLDLPDFGPASQDAAALELIRERGALADVDAGRFAAAVDKVRRVWASLPGAGYAQPERTLDQLAAQYIAAGGTIA